MRDALRAPLRAAAAAAFVVGTLLLLLDPPSLSGAEGFVTVIVAAVALVLVTAALTVALTGRDAIDEGEVERLVLRSEALARGARPAPTGTDFDALVADAIDALPDDFQALLERTPVVVSRHGVGQRAYGHYFGDTVARDDYPDRIVLYQDTLERDFGHDPELLRAQVEQTLRHELAHHLGWRERGVRELGL